MKLFKIAVTALLLSSSLLSCKKNDDVIIPVSNNNTVITNTTVSNTVWIGEYKTTSRSVAVYFSLDLQPASQLYILNESNEIIGVGSWAMNDSTFNAYYILTATQQAHTVSGVLTCATNLAGEWQFDNSYEDRGSWFLDKQ